MSISGSRFLPSFRLIFWFVLVFLIRPANSSCQTVVYNNGSPTYTYGIEISGLQEADDFVINSQTQILGVRFWTIEGYPFRANAKTFDGHLDYWIYDSLNNKPGANILATGVGQSIERIAEGKKLDIASEPLNGYQYTFYFQTPFTALPGTQYFLGLHLLNSYPVPYGEMYWSTAPGPIPFAPSYQYAGFNQWIDNSQTISGTYGSGHLAFQLIVPEPSTLALLTLGAIGLLAVRRR
jgi:hypothetical protein